MSDRRKTLEAVLDGMHMDEDRIADARDLFSDDCQYVTIESMDWPGALDTVVPHKTLDDAEKHFFSGSEMPYLIVDLDTGVAHYVEMTAKVGEVAENHSF